MVAHTFQYHVELVPNEPAIARFCPGGWTLGACWLHLLLWPCHRQLLGLAGSKLVPRIKLRSSTSAVVSWTTLNTSWSAAVGKLSDVQPGQFVLMCEIVRDKHKHASGFKNDSMMLPWCRYELHKSRTENLSLNLSVGCDPFPIHFPPISHPGIAIAEVFLRLHGSQRFGHRGGRQWIDDHCRALQLGQSGHGRRDRHLGVEG